MLLTFLSDSGPLGTATVISVPDSHVFGEGRVSTRVAWDLVGTGYLEAEEAYSFVGDISFPCKCWKLRP